MTKKFTEKDYFNAIKLLCEGRKEDIDPALSILEFCDKKLASLESKSKKDEAKMAMDKKIIAAILDHLDTENYKPAALLAEEINDPDITASKIRYRLTNLVADGIAEKEDVAYEGKVLKGYRKIS